MLLAVRAVLYHVSPEPLIFIKLRLGIFGCLFPISPSRKLLVTSMLPSASVTSALHSRVSET